MPPSPAPRSHSPYPHATRSPSPTSRNEPTCTCHTPSCPLHNGLWALLKRAGLALYIERVEHEEKRLNPTDDPEIAETLQLEGLVAQMPTVEEAVRRVVRDGWNLRSECWRWG